MNFLDVRNTSCSISATMLPKVILMYHVLVLTVPSRVSQNPFQNNMCCESSRTTRYQSEIL